MEALLCQPWVALSACLLLADLLADVYATVDIPAPGASSFANVGRLGVSMMSRQHLLAAACLQCFDEISAVTSQIHSSTPDCGRDVHCMITVPEDQ